MVARLTSGDAIGCTVFPAIGFSSNVVNRQAFIINRGRTTVCAGIVPRFFDSGPPQPPCFRGSHCLHFKEQFVWAQ
jgi:hypothetical protein